MHVGVLFYGTSYLFKSYGRLYKSSQWCVARFHSCSYMLNCNFEESIRQFYMFYMCVDMLHYMSNCKIGRTDEIELLFFLFFEDVLDLFLVGLTLEFLNFRVRRDLSD